MQTIQQGSRGAAVETAQRLLLAKGYSPGAVDGIFGPKTLAAVQAFQRAMGLAVDGIAGPKTWAALQGKDEPPHSAHFKLSEFACNRTAAYNQGCGGAKYSQHLTANAADIQVRGVSPSTVYAKLDALYPNQGLGKYATFTHLDLRGTRARW